MSGTFSKMPKLAPVGPAPPRPIVTGTIPEPPKVMTIVDDFRSLVKTCDYDEPVNSFNLNMLRAWWTIDKARRILALLEEAELK